MRQEKIHPSRFPDRGYFSVDGDNYTLFLRYPTTNDPPQFYSIYKQAMQTVGAHDGNATYYVSDMLPYQPVFGNTDPWADEYRQDVNPVRHRVLVRHESFDFNVGCEPVIKVVSFIETIEDDMPQDNKGWDLGQDLGETVLPQIPTPDTVKLRIAKATTEAEIRVQKEVAGRLNNCTKLPIEVPCVGAGFTDAVMNKVRRQGWKVTVKKTDPSRDMSVWVIGEQDTDR